MSERRKFGPIRQLSLQSEPNIRPILKKQLSIELLDTKENLKISHRDVSSGKTNKLADRPRPIRIAWEETKHSPKEECSFSKKNQMNDSVEVKKCKEYKRPTTAKVRSNSVEFFSKQELENRLKNVWLQKEETKPNLNIFLAPNIQNKLLDDEEDGGESKIEDLPKTKVEDMRNKLKKANSIASEFIYVPSTTNSKPRDIRTNISVTIPSMDHTKQPAIQEPIKEETKTPVKEREVEEVKVSPKEEETKLVRPSTASAKRESFQKRSNTAFNGTISSLNKDLRPPLTRMLSAPIKSDGNKLKFIANKRRLKSAKRRGKDNVSSEQDENQDAAKKELKNKSCGELVTMVSLVSPAGSDTEEQTEPKKEESKNVPPAKTEFVKTVTLRKTVKCVSFQQSTIHAIRSFSASFPSRRMSAILNIEREKRAPVETSPEGDSHAPKRRLLRAVSVSNDELPSSVSNSSSEDLSSNTEKSSEINEEVVENAPDEKEKDKNESTEDKESQEDPDAPKFETNKEKECWNMYKKMSDKGLPVSYDTILRGMLTPTEYRLRRKEEKS